MTMGIFQRIYIYMGLPSITMAGCFVGWAGCPVKVFSSRSVMWLASRAEP